MANRKAHRRPRNHRRSEDFVQHRLRRQHRSDAFEKACAERAERRATRRALTSEMGV